MAAGIGFFTACEDVPEPYNIPTGKESANLDSIGVGTLENPISASDAIAVAKQLASGVESDENYFIKGVVVSIEESFTSQYGNGTFNIADNLNASNTFKAYRISYLGNTKYTNGDRNVEVGDTVVIWGRIMNYRGTPETAQNKAFLYSLNGVNRGGLPGSTEPGEAKGNGTLDNPYNGAAANAVAGALASGAESDMVYIKGKISSIKEEFSTQYGNATFYISDDGTTTGQFYVFRSLYLGNRKWTSGDTQIKKGDEVVVCAKLTNYQGNTPETVQGATYLYSLNGQTTGGETQTKGIDVTCAQAAELTSALADGATSDETYSVTGYITEVIGSVSRNQQSFWMADTQDGGKVFEAYYANLPEGVSEFKVGSKVKITGQLMKYVKDGKVTPEIKNANVEILEDGGETPPPSGIEVTCVQAVELVYDLADGATSDEAYSVTGYITEVIGSVSRNQQSFWMADTQDGGKVFEAYYANLPEGVSEFKVGSKVKITGQLMKYVKDGKVTPEIKNANVEILEGGGGEPNPGTGGASLQDFANGDFETWIDGIPTGWQSTTTASTKGALSQSSDAHSGNYSVQLAGDSSGKSNKRLAYKELDLEAGQYTISFYVKSVEAGGSVTQGYVPVSDGKVGSYVYGDYTDNLPAEWTQITSSFELVEAKTVNLLIMNSKKGGKDLLIDDFSITKK